MSLFRRETEAPPSTPAQRQPAGSGPQASGPRDRPVTRIAEGTLIQGEVTGSAEVLVEGRVHGEIRLDQRVVVGPPGSVHGRISARTVLVAGHVEGDVQGSERVEVGGSGKVEGDISAPRVTIAEGAFFKGQVEMTGGAGRGHERPPSAAPPRGEAGPGKSAAGREGGDREPGAAPEGRGG